MKKSNFLSMNDFSFVIRSAKRLSDRFSLKVSPIKSEYYIPYVKIIIEPKRFMGLDFDQIGPFIYDMTSASIKDADGPKGLVWGSNINKGIDIQRPKQRIEKIISTALSNAGKTLKRNVYRSSLTGNMNFDRHSLEMQNLDIIKSEIASALKNLDRQASVDTKSLLSKIRDIDHQIMQFRIKLHSDHAGRMLQNLIAHPLKKGMKQQHRIIAGKIKSLKHIRERLDKRLSKIKYNSEEAKEKIENIARARGLKSIKKVKYDPTRKNLMLHSTIMLLPKKFKAWKY